MTSSCSHRHCLSLLIVKAVRYCFQGGVHPEFTLYSHIKMTSIVVMVKEYMFPRIHGLVLSQLVGNTPEKKSGYVNTVHVHVAPRRALGPWCEKVRGYFGQNSCEPARDSWISRSQIFTVLAGCNMTWGTWQRPLKSCTISMRVSYGTGIGSSNFVVENIFLVVLKRKVSVGL